MTTYNTGNPLGSKDPRDLYDNAENFDEAVNNRSADYWVDRLGVSRQTWAGIERSGGIQGFATLADLQTSPGQSNGQLAYVTNDPDQEKNGMYRWDSSGWVKSDSVSDLPMASAVSYPFRQVGEIRYTYSIIDAEGWVVFAIDNDGRVSSVEKYGLGEIESLWHSYPRRSTGLYAEVIIIDAEGWVVFDDLEVKEEEQKNYRGKTGIVISDGILKVTWQFDDDTLARVTFGPNGFNGLFNFMSYEQSEIGTNNWTRIVSTNSDMFPPLIFRVVENDDGNTSSFYTGGNHGTSGGAGGDRTARMVDIKAWIDGYPVNLTDDFEGYAESVRVRWVNEIMAHNSVYRTEQQGSPYALQQTFDVIFRAGGLSFSAGVKALEEIGMSADNGIQLFQTGFTHCNYFDGNTNGKVLMSESGSSGLKRDYPAWAMIFSGSYGDHGVWYDREFEAGDGRYIGGSAGYFRNGNNGKSYSVIVGGGGAVRSFSEGEGYQYSGGIVWCKSRENAPLDSAFSIYYRGKEYLAFSLSGSGDYELDVSDLYPQREIDGIGYVGIEPKKLNSTGYLTGKHLVR